MAELTQLLELLYEAHQGVDRLFLELRDETMTKPDRTLALARETDGAPAVRWVGGGPWKQSALLKRRIWFQRPDRIRVEVLRANTVVRVAVRNGSAWHQKYRNVESSGHLAQGTPLPPLLDLPILDPARYLHAMWFQATGFGYRNGREVLKATGTRRDRPSDTVEFEFDAEYGTPLRSALFEAGYPSATIEVKEARYGLPIDATLFI